MLSRLLVTTSSIITRTRHHFAHRTSFATTTEVSNAAGTAVAVPFDESKAIVRSLNGVSAEDGVSFTCDEEPHMVPVYAGGGYIPLRLGEKLKSRITGTEYEVLRKLGWGVDSSVWLAHTESKGYTAIKILTCAASTRVNRCHGYELEVLQSLGCSIDAGTAPEGHKYCTDAMEVFSVTSVHGGHFCFVFPLHALSLREFILELALLSFRGFTPLAVKNIARQVLLALGCLHSLGFVHTDVKDSNLLMCIHDFNQQDIADFVREHPSTTYEPRFEPSISADPIITVRSEPLPPFAFTGFETIRVCLGDYGEAIPVEKTVEQPLAMPMALRAPEITLGHPWGCACDIWAVGCLLLELITLRMGGVFDLDAGPASDMTSTHVHLARIQELIGPFPSAFLANCSQRETFFDSDGHLLQPLGDLKRYGDLSEQLTGAGLTGTELEQAEAFLRRCFSIDPTSRASAEELLEDSWLKDVVTA